MQQPRKKPVILLIYQGDQNKNLIADAARETKYMGEMTMLPGAEAALEYLDQCSPTAFGEQQPCPNLIIFDLATTLHRADELLNRLKTAEFFRPVPVIVLARKPIAPEFTELYDRGVNAFVERPSDRETMVRTLRIIEDFWIGVVQLPHADRVIPR